MNTMLLILDCSCLLHCWDLQRSLESFDRLYQKTLSFPNTVVERPKLSIPSHNPLCKIAENLDFVALHSVPIGVVQIENQAP